jgi:hypothetical protein
VPNYSAFEKRNQNGNKNVLPLFEIAVLPRRVCIVHAVLSRRELRNGAGDGRAAAFSLNLSAAFLSDLNFFENLSR